MIKENVTEAKEVAKSDPAWLNWYWPIFTVVALLAFAIPEAIGIINEGKGGSYTESIKKWLGVDPSKTSRRVGSTIFIAALVLFTIWFVPHITEWPASWPWES